MKQSLVLLVMVALVGCSESNVQPDDLLYTVEKKPFAIEVYAQGELESSNRVSITVPASSNGPQTLSWIMPEYSEVKKGDVIARFDGSTTERRKRTSEYEQAKLNQDLNKTKSDLSTREEHLFQDIKVVQGDKDFAQQFAINDTRILSKLDILDRSQNVDYLNAQANYYAWQKSQFTATSQGEIELLTIQVKQHQQKIKMYDKNLSSLEIVAPNSGLLTHAANWRGDKPKPGLTMWPGHEIAGLPDITSLQAKLHIHEKEAIGIEAGQRVEFSLLSDSKQTFFGKVKSVSPYPQSIERGDPQKYYEVIATLDEQNPNFRPGFKINAKIHALPERNVLTVPKHSVINEQQSRYVLVLQNGQLQKVPVELGQSNFSHSEVTSGLQAGQKISLLTDMGSLN
ncbi:efflux RND transporter periplasmic adaptor subunit (plasmid) [Pseudoalteromonas sp. T1lg65]|uniref:efflux RND transporter periplasmic adaptor subunit n=1 Tax=Pseudoalteromonas sp. T1lg65 TaxID=2077101 RepID=UPI003F78E383